MPDGSTPPLTWDVDQDGTLTVNDLYAWHEAPIDLDGDGLADQHDAALVRDAVRWFEPGDVSISHMP